MVLNMEMPKNEVKIRLANDGDFSSILNIWLDGIDNSFDKLKMSDELYKKKFRENFNNRSGIFNFWVAVDLSDSILGWQSLIKASNNPFRENFYAESSTYISKAARKQGVGELLLDFVIKEAKGSTLTHVVGFVSFNNNGAKKITSNTGWIEIGIIPVSENGITLFPQLLMVRLV
jgi:L-amino acid N-acyltransferase YncA